MKFNTQKEKLLEAVSLTTHLATTRATLPILQNIYLEAQKDSLLVKSTDLDQTIEVVVDGVTEETGSLTVPARLLTDYLVNNPDQNISLSSDDTNLKVKSANNQASIKGLSSSEYPTQASVKSQFSVAVSIDDLQAAIIKTLFAAAQDETRPILNGLLWRFDGQKLTMVGTDGYRLAMQEITIQKSSEGDFIVPKKTLQEVQKLPGSGEIKIELSHSQIKFVIGNITLISRLLDGAFPSFEAIIPKKNAVEFKMSVSHLSKSLKLATLFSRDTAYSTKLSLKTDKLVINAISPQVGENSSEIKLTQPVAQEISISINAQYLLDALAVVSDDAIIGLTDAKSPFVVKEGAESNYLFLLMPLRVE